MAQPDRVDGLIRDARAFVGSRPSPDLTSAVMQQVARLDVHAAGSQTGWITRLRRTLWSPQLVSFQFRPVYGLIAAAGLIVLVGFVQHQRSIPANSLTAATEAADQTVMVQFRLQVSDAMDVRLAGSFTNWQAQYQLHETAPGLWTITVPLAPGVHDYAFIVDGRRWMTDPFANTVQDGFGGTNSRLTLVGGSDRRL